MYSNALLLLFLLVAAVCVATTLGVSLVLLWRGRLDLRGKRLTRNLLAGSILAMLAMLAMLVWFGFLDGMHRDFPYLGRRLMGR